MALSASKKKKIEELLLETIENKLKRYARETVSMPFLVRLIQDSRKVASYSFIHSLATSLGMSIYEDVSIILAEGECEECFRKYDIGGVISKEQKSAIDTIVRELRNGERTPDYKKEMNVVLAALSKDGKMMYSGVDFLVGEQYWDFIDGKNTFKELLMTLWGSNVEMRYWRK